jgi:hypothetical protein
MRIWLAFLLVGCAAEVAPLAVDAGSSNCTPPVAREADGGHTVINTLVVSDCYDPGGGVIRCELNDGTYWDLQPSGNRVHWRYADETGVNVAVICEVKP